MRIIKRAMLVAYGERNPQARHGLAYWHELARSARWTCFQGVRTTFPHADAVTVASGRSVVVFNIAGNRYRLIAAIHYNRGLIFTLMVLTHREYSDDRWKDAL
jgi:mRNA interferase HigB